MAKVVEIDAKKARETFDAAIAKVAKESKLNQRLITKIRIGTITTIEYDRPTDTELEHCIVKIEDAIHPDFEIKLNQLIVRAIDAIGLDEAVWKEAKVTGVDIKRAGDISGCKIHLKNQLEDFEISLSTPFLAVELGWSDQIQLDQLCQEAEDCLDGKRAQGDLFFGREDV